MADKQQHNLNAAEVEARVLVAFFPPYFPND